MNYDDELDEAWSGFCTDDDSSWGVIETQESDMLPMVEGPQEMWVLEVMILTGQNGNVKRLRKRNAW